MEEMHERLEGEPARQWAYIKSKTTPTNVAEANDALFHATMNLPALPHIAV